MERGWEGEEGRGVEEKRKHFPSHTIFNSYSLTLYEANGDYGHGSLLSCHNPSPNLFPHTPPPSPSLSLVF